MRGRYQQDSRPALEWVLDQYRERKPRDPTIAQWFNNYCFADYKERVIDLLQRVCAVSVRTVEIAGRMAPLIEELNSQTKCNTTGTKAGPRCRKNYLPRGDRPAP